MTTSGKEQGCRSLAEASDGTSEVLVLLIGFSHCLCLGNILCSNQTVSREGKDIRCLLQMEAACGGGRTTYVEAIGALGLKRRSHSKTPDSQEHKQRWHCIWSAEEVRPWLAPALAPHPRGDQCKTHQSQEDSREPRPPPVKMEGRRSVTLAGIFNGILNAPKEISTLTSSTQDFREPRTPSQAKMASDTSSCTIH